MPFTQLLTVEITLVPRRLDRCISIQMSRGCHSQKQLRQAKHDTVHNAKVQTKAILAYRFDPAQNHPKSRTWLISLLCRITEKSRPITRSHCKHSLLSIVLVDFWDSYNARLLSLSSGSLFLNKGNVWISQQRIWASKESFCSSNFKVGCRACWTIVGRCVPAIKALFGELKHEY